MTVPSGKDAPARRPLLTLPWEGGLIGWAVVGGAMLAEVVGGLVTNQMPMAIAAPVLVLPVAVAAGFAVVQWLQARSSGAERASWWHLAGIAVALLVWLVFPTKPGIFATESSARAVCYSIYTATPACLSRATQAMDGHNLTWWLTGGLILAAALLARRSRIAPWAAIPLAFAGCLLAAHFLQLVLLYYHAVPAPS